MAFTDTLALLPFRASTPNGRGFLPPIVRALGHILYLLGCVSDPDVTVTPAEALTELRHAQTHWNARVASPNLSTATNQYSNNISTLIAEAILEYEGWNESTQRANLRHIANRVLQFTVALDREYAGIRDSDAGTAP